MPHYLGHASAATLPERRPISWRVFFDGAIEMVKTWARRRRHRQELLDYITIDHRAAADMGISGTDTLDWAKRPFWRP
jgi:uncharacterized protein YjiS (DUF1127 family)